MGRSERPWLSPRGWRCAQQVRECGPELGVGRAGGSPACGPAQFGDQALSFLTLLAEFASGTRPPLWVAVESIWHVEVSFRRGSTSGPGDVPLRAVLKPVVRRWCWRFGGQRPLASISQYWPRQTVMFCGLWSTTPARGYGVLDAVPSLGRYGMARISVLCAGPGTVHTVVGGA